MKILIDTDKHDPFIRCLLCGKILEPDQHRIIIGQKINRKQQFTSLHWGCWYMYGPKE